MNRARQSGGAPLERRVKEQHKEHTVRNVLTRHKAILDGNGNPITK